MLCLWLQKRWNHKKAKPVTSFIYSLSTSLPIMIIVKANFDQHRPLLPTTHCVVNGGAPWQRIVSPRSLAQLPQLYYQAGVGLVLLKMLWRNNFLQLRRWIRAQYQKRHISFLFTNNEVSREKKRVTLVVAGFPPAFLSACSRVH